MADNETSAVCDGCKEDLDLLKTHLSVVVKPVKKAWVVPTVAQRDEDTAYEADDAVSTLGERTGVAETYRFHSEACMAEYFSGKKNAKKTARLTYNTEDDFPRYAAGADVMHEPVEEDGNA